MGAGDRSVHEMRKTGVDVVGDMPWGTHFCVFYDTKADLLETLVSYCRAGLQSGEFCLWVVAAPLTEEDARQALTRAVPGFDRYVVDRSIEIVAARDWYLHDGKFDLKRVVGGWNEKLAHASARGYAGVRVTGDTAWLEKNDWKDFCEYEESLNDSIANQRLAVLCTYPIGACGAAEILDVVRTHQFAITKRRGSWEVIETAGHKQAKAEITRLNEDLERRVADRTGQLTAANRQLRTEALERERAERVLREQAHLLDLTHDTVFVRDMSDVITYWNHAAEALYGWTSQEAVGKVPYQLLQTIFPVPLDAIRAELLRTGRWEGELVHTKADGSQVAVASRWSLQRDERQQPRAILETNNDMTGRKRADQAVKDLAGRLIHAQEEERSRIGRELHDHISQTLGVLTIKIDQLRAREEMTPGIHQALGELRSNTGEITEDVHRLSHRLHSSTLDYLGLVPALQKLVSEFSERHGIAITFAHASLPAPLPSDVALCLFRIAEEALTNIAKHSKARSANIHVVGAPDGLHLRVEDAGTGFDTAILASKAGLGFVSMQERLRVLHGTIQVDSDPSRGTKIKAWVPPSVLTSPPSPAQRSRNV